jgi:hypothetical protein
MIPRFAQDDRDWFWALALEITRVTNHASNQVRD